MHPKSGAGEAVPKITRRMFLSTTAAVSAVGVPAAAVAAPPEPANASVRDLLAAHAAAKAEAAEFDRLAYPIYQDPNRPPLGKVLYKEMRFHFRPMTYAKDEACYVQSALDNMLDRRKHQIGLLSHPDLYEPAERPKVKPWYDGQIAEAEAEHARVSAILKERDDTYHRWEVESGWAAASEQSEKLWSRAFELGEEILYFDSQSIDDVRIVARFIRTEYEDEFSADVAAEFVKRLAGEIGGAE